MSQPHFHLSFVNGTHSPPVPSSSLPLPPVSPLNLSLSSFIFSFSITLSFSSFLSLLLYLSCFPSILFPPPHQMHVLTQTLSPAAPRALSAQPLSRAGGRAYRPYVVPGISRSLADMAWQPGKHLFSPGPHAANTLEHLHALTLLLPVSLS